MRALARKRRLAALSQHELSRRAGVRFSRVHYAESNRLKLRRDELQRIEAVLRAVLIERQRQIAGILG